MRNIVLVTLLAATIAGCGGGEPADASTELRIAFWEDSAQQESRVDWLLACDPPAGTHPDPAAACARLDETGAAAFAPLPDQACTEIYGGAQRAEISGTVDGEPVDASFQRTNGCEIEAWDALLGVLPPGGVDP
jgi:hypothetical protein